MFDYIKGQVKAVEKDYITIENNGLGFLVYAPKPNEFKTDEEAVAYIYNVVREDEFSLYGFKTKEERELFLKLITVKGVGPRTALGMISLGSVSGIIDAIERENIMYLKSLPKIGPKAASQIILDLKGKLQNADLNIAEDELEIMDVLKQLGYTKKEITGVLKELDSNRSIDERIKEALKKLSM